MKKTETPLENGKINPSDIKKFYDSDIAADEEN